MKSLYTYIFEDNIDKFFNEINNEIICEKLQDPKLIELAKYLKKFTNKHSKFNSKSFGELLGKYPIQWDKVKESDWKEITNIEEAKKYIGKINSNSANKFLKALMLIERDNKIIYMITDHCYINFYSKKSKYNYDNHEYEYYTEPHKDDYDIKTKQLKEKIKEGDICYLLETEKFEQETLNIKRERSLSKRDMVLQGDEEYYSKLAKDNIERYKKIIAKNKAEEAAKKDNLCEKVQDVINKVMELSVKIFKGGPQYADLEFKIGNLIESINSQKTYDSKRCSSSGSDGLLKVFNYYISSSLSVVKDGGYGYEQKNIDLYKIKLTNLIQKIESQIVEIESKL